MPLQWRYTCLGGRYINDPNFDYPHRVSRVVFADPPWIWKLSHKMVSISQLGRPDGSQLRVECYGREDAPSIILTHGWGTNSTEWDYLKIPDAQLTRLAPAKHMGLLER